MFGNARFPSEVEMVAAPNEFEAVYDELRARMVASVRHRALVPVDDVEDVVHNALEKLLSEKVRAGAPRLSVRAFTAFRDKRAEYYRRQEHSGETMPLTLTAGDDGYEHERPELASADQALAMFELRATISAIAGQDAMRFALLKACGATEPDIAILLGWPPARAAAARVQLSRKKAQIAQAVLDTLTEGGNTW
jgi:DNA-directed RNA polymerase specialized sigma24 family protein